MHRAVCRAVLDRVFQQVEQGARQQSLIGQNQPLLTFLINFVEQLDAFLLGDGQCLIEDVQYQHREQCRAELVGLGLSPRQQDETIGQIQRAAHLTLNLLEQRRISTRLVTMHIQQGEDRRMGGAQVVGKKTQQDAALLLGRTLGTQVRQAEQPTDRRIAVDRQQRRSFQAQAALLVIAKFQQRQGGQRRSRRCG